MPQEAKLARFNASDAQPFSTPVKNIWSFHLRPLRPAVRPWIPWTLLVVGVVLSGAASWLVFSSAEASARAEFVADAQKTRQLIEIRLNAYFDITRASAALLAANPEVSGAEFGAFVQGLQLRDRYPGVQGIGFSARVRGPDVPSFLRGINREGAPRFRIWPSAQQAEYFPVVFLEPSDGRSSKAIGFDLAANAIVRAAMEWSRDSDRVTVSRRVDEQEPFHGAVPSVLLLAPVYRLRTQLATNEDRRRALVGFVFSPLRSTELLHAVHVGSPSSVVFEVYEGPITSPGALLSDPAPVAEGAHSTIESVDIGGGRWFIPAIQQERVNPMPAAPGLLVGGLLLSFLLFVIMRAQVRAWAVAVRHEAELRESVQRDVLTGLPNRAIFGEHLSQAIALARRHGHHLAVLFMDVDRFKDINDSLGHAIGDQLLQQIGGRLLACVRSSDTVSRQGGDEFVLLLSEITQAEDAGERTQHIINALTGPYTVTYHEIHITVSVGISVYPSDGEDAATLMRAADTAMYQAKERGRNNYQFFAPEMNTRTVERLWIEGGLRRALAQREFAMRYQPTVDLQTGAITGAEALLRWVHPHRGVVNPLDFIPVAEHCGLIVPIGEWVLHTACAQARAWLEAGLRIPVAVNVSALEFRDSRFLERIAAALQESQLESRYLKLELTESVLMQHAASTVSVLEALKRMGVTIAVDDFGTGYSSLSYLRQFPIDELKVDQSFVQEISSDRGGSAIVSAIISMAQSLGLRVIAEGVETQEQLGFLQTQRCGEGQGFYFSRPVAADQFAEIVKFASGSTVSVANCQSCRKHA